MDDLRQRFATLDLVPVPDVWSDIERRLETLGTSAPTGRLTAVQPQMRAGAVTTPGSAEGRPVRRRTVALLVLALLAAVLIGGAIAVGSGLLRLTSDMPPAPSADLSRVIAPASPSPDTPHTDNPQPSSTEPVTRGSGSWTLTGTMKNGRLGETATLLPNGQVLVAGGWPGDSVLSPSAELYDPISGRWTETGRMHWPRGQGHSATLLPDGRVLVAGGSSIELGHPPQGSAELYDPVTGTWNDTGSMLLARSHHSATLLHDGKVLVVGGAVYSNKLRPSKRAEVYDPATGTWTSTGSMTAGLVGPTAALLPDGKVLVVGGSESATPDLQSAELYDPRGGTWSAAPSFAGAGSCRIATPLSDGEVLVVCAEANGARTSAELYDPTTGGWATTASAPAECCVGEAFPRGSIVLLRDGRVLWKDLVDPGELYDQASGTWTSAGAPTYPADPSWGLGFTGTDEGAGYYADTFTLLPDGRVLMTTMGAGLLYDPNGVPR